EPSQIHQLEDLAPTIELYHHTIHAGQYDAAWTLYNERLRMPLYYHLCEYELDLQLLAALPYRAHDSPKRSLSGAQIWPSLYRAMCYERRGQTKSAQDCAQKEVQIAHHLSSQND